MRQRTEQIDELEVAPGWLVVDPPSLLPSPVRHLLIGTGGVLAVARWGGAISVVHGVLHQDGRRRELQSADLVREGDRIAALLHRDHRSLVAPVVAIPGDQPPLKVTPGLILVGEDELAWTLEGLPTHLGPDDIADIVGRIAQARARRTDQLPTQATLAAELTAGRSRRPRR